MNRLSSDGYVILPDVVPDAHIQILINALEAHRQSKGDSAEAGLRNLAGTLAEIDELRGSGALLDIASSVLGQRAFVVRTLFFDKTPNANWKVAWHQDLTIAVRERMDAPGFGPWSVKDGIPHVQPPAELLERMITLRLHLDSCDATNGALRVLPGSHLAGKFNAEQIRDWRSRTAEVTCEVPRGGLLLMRPLLLHASSPATEPRHRRVLHFEFAAESLPAKLAWYEAEPFATPAF
ncbi:MAG: phytanoyl-CoA dioxygenase [Verrucomicrobiaceae bacterium]|nr:MAG: phytanoyl-CoA dioxygenase [Verrucomicrobiaceae bacterium]